MTRHDRKLWQRVEYWRERIDQGRVDSDVQELEKAWQRAHKEDVAADIYQRDEFISVNPIDKMLDDIAFGFYPPPEIMLTISECLEEYLSEKKGLEEALFGRSIQKSGNYARRYRRRNRNAFMIMRYHQLRRRGMTPVEAGETIVIEQNLDIDAESVVEIARRSPLGRTPQNSD